MTNCSAVTKELLAILPADERKVAASLLGYPENSIGRLMMPDYIAVHPEWTVRYVLDYIREHGADSETLSNIYVIDVTGLLIYFTVAAIVLRGTLL